MTAMDDRRKAFEEQFKHSLELRFRVEVRRCKRLALWAAAQMNLGEEGAVAYAKDLVSFYFDHPAEEDLIQRLFTDLNARGVDLSEHRLRRQVRQVTDEVKDEIYAAGS